MSCKEKKNSSDVCRKPEKMDKNNAERIEETIKKNVRKKEET